MISRKSLSRGVAAFKRFHRYASEKISSVDLPFPKAVVLVGQALFIEYRSDKIAAKKGPMSSRRQRHYRHKFGAGVRVYMDPGGKALYIVGGKFRVTDWLRN